MKANVEYLEFLYAALHSRFGVIIETDNAELLRQRLYAIRREEPEFEPLSFLISPANGKDLWIMKRIIADAQD